METLKSSVQALEHLLSNKSLHLFPDFQQQKALLQHLGYIQVWMIQYVSKDASHVN